MNCPACAHENRPGARFCEECAAPLKRECAGCGSELRPSAKFCDECGAATGAGAAPRRAEPSDARKVVTIVFADLVGSTALHERLDPESARRFMEGYYAAMRGAVESHGGSVTQFLGDGVKAVFGIPRVAEDDAIRAVRAAVAMQAAFRALADPQREAIGKTGLRVAVNTGEVVASDASEIIGDPVNVAARLQEQGRDGDVVIGEATERLVSALVTLDLLGRFALKGRTEAVSAWRVISLDRPVSAATTAFVGRADELARIESVFGTVIAKPATGLAVLLGSPGLGKSRLIEELARRLGDGATVIRAHCDAAGGASFAPLADALRVLPDLDTVVPGSETEGTRILDGVRALIAGSPASPEETFFVVRRLLAALAATKPVVLVIDDLHWAEPLLLDLVEHLVQWGSGVPLLVLIGARPELREIRSTLATPGGLVSEVVTLAGLDAGAAMRLAANVIGAADLPASVAAKVLAASEGNPLFVGELVRMLVHEGALKREGDRWTAGTTLAALEMPPTIHALLAARIERLRPEERVVLERAAVIGRAFSRSAVSELLSRDVTDLDARLESLRRAELIERDSGWFLGEPVLRFHHVLIRDAAYRRILKGTRADLHARFADWVEIHAAESVEHDETIGWHLEQAHQHLRELGPIDARGRALGERGAQRLAAAGRRALARDDVRLASGLLGRALDRLDRDDAARAELALDWCEALLASGDVGPATGALEELDRFAASDARLRAWHTCFAGQLTTLTAPQGLNAAAEAVAKAASDLAALGDVAGEAKAHFVHAQAFMRLGKVGGCEAALDRALASARRAGDRRRANTVLAVAPLAALWGPSPVTRASGRCLDVVRVLRITQGAPAVEAVALSCQGVLEALRGRTDAARRMIASARKMVEELGITQRLLEVDVFAGLIELYEGDAVAAERWLRAAYRGLREHGLGIDAARAAALLARALLEQGQAAEAEAFSHESETLAGDDLQAAIVWRGVRAEALARRGEHASALEFARAAVEIASTTDALLDHAGARLSLASALLAAGRLEEADAEERQALALWEAKGATLLAERARRERPKPARVAPAPERRTEPARAPRRPVRANAASASGAAFEAAASTRDIETLERVFSDPCVVVHHPTGRTFGRREQLTSWKSMFRAEHLTYRRVVVATLGDSLALTRHWISVAGLRAKPYESFGDSEFEELYIGEDDGHGQMGRIELFAGDQLGAALARLYERHAELLPEGAEREVAASFASASGAMLAPAGTDAPLLAAFQPDIELVDRRILGTWSARGAAAALRHFQTVRQVASEAIVREDDVLALEPDILLTRRTHTGAERLGGGDYERQFLMLLRRGPDGRLARIEFFDDEREAEALARVEELMPKRATSGPSARRVRPNAASAVMARFEAAFASRDVETLGALYAETATVIDHPNGASYGREGEIESIRNLLRARETRWSHTPLATLGGALSLHNRSVAARGASGGRFDVADYEVDHLVVIEVDKSGRYLHVDVFGAEHLGDAIARLYERHAELLPEGPERIRVAATARSLAALLGPPDIDRIAAALAPNVETNDHKLLGYGPARGADAVLQSIRVQIETADAISPAVDDVLSLHARALLVRRTVSGVIRESGGRYEKEMLSLYVCNSDGLVERWEQFDPEREAEALARLDALVGGEAAAPESPFANAAWRMFQAFSRAWIARDWKTIEGQFSPALRMDDRRRMVRLQIGADDFLTQLRMLFDQPGGRWDRFLVATRGDRLALCSGLFRAEVEGGGGPLEFAESLSVYEIEVDSRIVALVVFDPEDWEAAYAELDARFDAGEGAAHAQILATVRARERAHANRDWDAWGALAASDFRYRDHRLLGWGTGDVPAGALIPRSLVELAPDVRVRRNHIRLCERGALLQITNHGTRDGGAFEMVFVAVVEMDAQGRQCCNDTYDVEQIELAKARFEELRAITPAPFANAASRLVERGFLRWASRDWDGIVSEISPAIRMDDRRRIMRLEIGYEAFLAQFRMLFDQPGSRWRESLLGTRGERLSLHRTIFEADVAGGGGPLAFDEHISLTEVDVDGRWIASVTFDLDDADAAWAELDARYAAGADKTQAASLTVMREFTRAISSRDWAPMLALCSPALVEQDHRPLAVLGTTRGAEAWVQNFRVLADLAPDSRYRVEHFRATSRGFCSVGTWVGTREGGRYEIPLVAVIELDAHERISRADVYDADQLDRARARFDALIEVGGESAPASDRFANAASRTDATLMRCFNTRDWEGVLACAAPELVFDERRRMTRNTCGRDIWLEQFRLMFDVPSSRFTTRLLATRGERLSLNLHCFAGEVAGGGGPLAIEDHFALHEIDRDGRIVALVLFDQHDLDAAHAELDARFDAGETALHPRASAAIRTGTRSFSRHDWEGLAALFSPTFVCHDHRLLGWGTVHGATAFIEMQRVLVELAPDARTWIDHIRISDRAYLMDVRGLGTRDGGEFERVYLRVTELDALGKVARVDLYDTDQADAALARFEELCAATEP